MKLIKDILDFKVINLEGYSLSISQIILIVAIILITKAILWVIHKGIDKAKKLQSVDEGNREALYQILRYIIWVISIAITLESIGVKVNVILAGSAALLVGLGFGLQQLLNDIVSGIILLIEGSVRVRDILIVESEVVIVKEIGLRTSLVMNQDDIIFFLPNSKLVNERVVNMSHQNKDTRFSVKVGVAYGSDVPKVVTLLKESAEEHSLVCNDRKPIVRFKDFGNSSLDFELLFWSKELFGIEDVLSDIRIAINHKFIQHHIAIPFPQRDLHIKSSMITEQGNTQF